MSRFIVFVFLLSAFGISAQPIRTSSAKQKLMTAELALEQHDVYNALEIYKEYNADLEEKDINITWKLAELSMAIRDYPKAARYYRSVVRKKNKRGFVNPYMPDARLKYAKALKMDAEYEDAQEQLSLYIAESEDVDKIAIAKLMLEGAQMGRELDPVVGFTLENAGSSVNTKLQEQSPQIVNGNELYYISIPGKKPIELDGAKDGEGYSRLFVARKDGEKGGFGEAKPFEGPNLNREGYHIGGFFITEDGKKLYHTRILLEGQSKVVESKLYVSNRGGDEWNAAQPVDGLEDVIIQHPMFGELFGNKVLFFSSNMDGGYGGYDLYYATVESDGFSTPSNLGPSINTIGDELTPFYRDGKLWFSSDMHPSIGGFDVFRSEWDGANWSDPENLSKPFNSPADDLYFRIDADEYEGMVVSNREGTKSAKGKTCCDDIWIFTRDNVVLDLITILTSEQKPLNGVKVNLVETVDKTEAVQDTRIKENANEYNFALQMDKAYKVVASKEGYLPDSLTFTTLDLRKSQTITKKLNLKPLPPEEPDVVTIKAEEPIRLNNINYDFDDDKILPEAEPDLQYLMDLMNQYPDMVIELSSHTDSQGGTAYNQKLSQRRANSAKAWLVERGVAEARVQPVGYGEEKILNQCTNGVECSDEEHRVNRRTEFKIIAGPKTITISKKVEKDK